MISPAGPIGISVVVATYNGERHLAEQLRSVLGQTVRPLEIVVSDDGSTDGTQAVVEKISGETDIPVRWVMNTRRSGFADNFLSGAAHATGRFVAFCDQDDRWHSTKLERARSAMMEHGALVSAHAVDLVNGEGEPLGADSQGIGSTAVVPALTGDPWQKYFGFTMLVERWLLDVIPADLRGEDTHTPGKPLSHDRWLWFLGASLGPSLVIAEHLASYRQHDSQLYGAGRDSRGRLDLARRKAGHYRRSIVGAGPQARFLAEVCARRADLLAQGQGPDRDALRIASQRWARLGEHYGARAAMHEASSWSARVRAAASIVRTRVYGPHALGGLGSRIMVQDLGALLPGRR